MKDDDFDLDSLAAFLHRRPEEIRRMVDRGRLPGRKIGGEWRFARADIHHWLEEQIGTSDAEELVEMERVVTEQGEVATESLSELLLPEAIFIPFAARTRNSVISRFCEQVADAGLLWDPEKMAEAIRSREQLHPTALESGVALLHARRPLSGILARPFLGLAVTQSGIPFGGPRGALTDIFFLIASTDEGQHLRTLARLSRVLQQEGFLAGLRAAEGPEGARACLAEAAAGLDD